ncbi:PadR family transcriptional regulator, partial [Nostocoides japonicum]
GPRRGPGGFGGPGGPEAFFGPFGAGFPDPADRLRRARRGPGRGRRGDVRNAILALLAEEPMNGYQVIAAIAERTEGLWRPSAGSVYPALGLLEDEGLIVQVEQDGKKVYRLTEEGTAYVTAHAEELTDPWARVASPHEAFLDVRQEMHALMVAVGQVAQAGDPAQVTAAKAVLADAKRSLYRILAGDDPSGHTGSEPPVE